MDKHILIIGAGIARLGNFYMAGQWVEPGGSVPLAAASGKAVIQLLCAADGKQRAQTGQRRTAPG
jgi:hypothetical protein